MMEPVITHKLLDEYVVNTMSLHNAHLLRKAIPHTLMSPVPLIPPAQHQSEHTRAVAAWHENPKSHTAQEQVRQEKKRAAEKEEKEKPKKEEKEKPKNKHGKKHSANEAFMGEGNENPE